MAKINTTNYQPVTAWNGTQDLLIVEQPDGTKVATPEQVKQYVEAGDFEATGEIKDGNGNVLSDVVEEIGDLTQTGLTGDSVAAQLDDASGQIAKTAKTLDIDSTSFDISSKLPVGKSAAVIVSDSNLCIAFSQESNSLSGVVSRLANNVYAWNLATFNYKFVYVRTDASFTVSRRFYAAGTSF